MTALGARAQELTVAGEPQEALAVLQQVVRAHPADAKLRVFLFQLLAVTGQWQRALTQLKVCGDLDAGTLAMVATYRELLQCEAVREAVWDGKTTPIAFGEPQAWVALLVEAIQADARGNEAAAQQLRAQAFDAAPTTPGRLNGDAFDWIADADSRLGPVLEAVIEGRYCWVPYAALTRIAIEAPTDLRDVVWLPATLEFPNGGQSVAFLPARYPGSGAQADGALQLGRRTDWALLAPDHAPDQYRGLGQRVLATSSAESGLLDVREIVLEPV